VAAWTPETMARSYLELYRRVLDLAAAGAAAPAHPVAPAVTTAPR
jgi:hypothetical protein